MAAIALSTLGSGTDRLLSAKLALVGDRFTRRDQHVERDGFVAGGLDFDPVSAGVDPELLEDAVEVVDHAHEVAVDVDLGVARLDLQPERSGRPASVGAAAVAALIAATTGIAGAVAAATVVAAVVVRVV